MASIVYPKEITASQIVSYIRATNNSRGSQIKKIYKMVNDKVEILEFDVSENAKVLNKALKI